MLTIEEKTFRARLLALLKEIVDTEKELITKIDELNKNLTGATEVQSKS